LLKPTRHPIRVEKMVNITANPVNANCPKNEAIFYDTTVFSSSPINTIGDKMKEKIISYFKHIVELKDDRLLVLISDLLLENTVDNYLSAIMPAYKENINFTFFTKICVAKALRLSPSKFFDGADLVRRIRNEFAHNIETRTFETLKPKLIDEIVKILRSYYPTKQPKEETIQEQFKSLTMLTYVALNNNIENIRSLNSFLRDELFHDTLLAYCQEKSEK
jgi:hypothetical protein